jgi:xylulokinase
MTYLIGVDIGTMGTKAGLYDESGHLVADAFEESRLLYPAPGAVEQLPDDLYGAALRTIKACIDKSGIEPHRIAGLAFDGQMAGVCSIGPDWEATTVYDSWLDTRCAPYIEQLKRLQGEIIRSAGGPPSFSHGAKMLYWKNEHPEVYRRIAKFLMPSAYVAGRMAALRADQAFIDRTFLPFSNFADTRHGRWNQELLREFGLDDAKLPRIVDPTEIIGRVSGQAAALTGLVEGTPIAAGCGDATANVLGAGIVEPGMVFDVAGTASIFSIVLDRYVTDERDGMLFTCPHVIPGLYFAMAYINGGGLNLRWFRDEFSQLEKAICEADDESVYQRLGRMAEKAPPGSEKLLFLPHLGGRVCPNNGNMRGAFVGLNWIHKKSHLYRAIMEGVGYEYRAYLKGVEALMPGFGASQIIGIGGGARSQVFKQIKADILGVPYRTLDREEFGTLGSALVAGKAVGLFDDLAASARAMNRSKGAPVEPNRALQPLYDDMAAAYNELLSCNQPVFERLARVRG